MGERSREKRARRRRRRRRGEGHAGGIRTKPREVRTFRAPLLVQ
jgi:hypothetical protein